MRLGVIWNSELSAANYRAIEPMRAMQERGHDVVWPRDRSGRATASELAVCDVVHVHRCFDDRTFQVLRDLVRLGVPFTWDNDDDFTNVPKGVPLYRELSGAAGRRVVDRMRAIARMAYAVTTTGPVLADRYRAAGIERVAVVENALCKGVSRPRVKHAGVVIGWVAGLEHRIDAERLGLRDAVQRLLEEQPDVRFECVGVDLSLVGDRYRHEPAVHFDRLPARLGGFDIGIAPLADVPFNHARSDIKVKEYAASKVAWLASPVGPYASLGAQQGGRLVSEGRWYEELSELAGSRRDRRRLARSGRSWAKRHTIDATAPAWERIFTEAAATRAVAATA